MDEIKRLIGDIQQQMDLTRRAIGSHKLPNMTSHDDHKEDDSTYNSQTINHHSHKEAEMIHKKLLDLLEKSGVPYTSIDHPRVFVANKVAAVTNASCGKMAKTVIVWMDGNMTMLVLPASCKADFDLLRKETGAKYVSLAKESEFKSLFPDCETGAMPPFGQLFGIRTIIDNKVTKPDHVIFRAGSHDTAVKMRSEDFHELAGAPKPISFSVRNLPDNDR